MKTIVAVLAAATFAGPALAGGPIEVQPEPVVTPVYEPIVTPGVDWSGAYAGVQLGYADVDSNEGGLDGNGMLGGIHAGYRWDMGQYVVGTELAYDLADIDLGPVEGDSLDDVASVKLLGGAKVGRSLFYGTIGAAHASANVGGLDLSDSGYLYGAGMDYAISDRLSVGGELLQHKFDDFDSSGVDFDATTLKAKVSLRF